MNRALVQKIANAVLYEGYVLYPYRPSVKNRQRWSFGGVLPQGWCAREVGDSSVMQTECLVRGEGTTRVQVVARFLQAVERRVRESTANREVEALTVDGKSYPRWQEAVEREFQAGEFALDALVQRTIVEPFTFERERALEEIQNRHGIVAGLFVREREEIAGEVEVRAELRGNGLYRLRVRVMNRTAGDDFKTRDDAVLRGFLSTHLLLGVQSGRFVSLTDPPADCAAAAAGCSNIGAWPVLVGQKGATDTVLSSPIILPDYPEVAAESPGDLFDGTEIDEILTLRILTLSEEEKLAAAATDGRVRALLQRTESLEAADLERMHGALRAANAAAEMEGWDPFATAAEKFVRLERTQLPDGTFVAMGDRVVLRPERRADIFDLALAGKVATVVAIEQDYEQRVHLAVTVDDDPGKDLGAAGKIAHRFFFGVEEVELSGGAA